MLKHPSRVPCFDDLSNFVNAVTVNGVTHCVVTTLTNMTFSFIYWKHESLKLRKSSLMCDKCIHFNNAYFNRCFEVFSQKQSNNIDQHSITIDQDSNNIDQHSNKVYVGIFLFLADEYGKKKNNDVVLVS